jgi:hypothetical protein
MPFKWHTMKRQMRHPTKQVRTDSETRLLYVRYTGRKEDLSIPWSHVYEYALVDFSSGRGEVVAQWEAQCIPREIGKPGTLSFGEVTVSKRDALLVFSLEGEEWATVSSYVLNQVLDLALPDEPESLLPPE